MWFLLLLIWIYLGMQFYILLDIEGFWDKGRERKKQEKLNKWIQDHPPLTWAQENAQYIEGFKKRYPGVYESTFKS